MSIGKKIRELRRTKDVSQEELGKIIGAHLTNVSRYERDQQIPSALVIKRIAEAFNISADYLLFDDTDISESEKVRLNKFADYFEKLEDLPEEDKKVILAVIESMVVKNRLLKEQEKGQLLEVAEEKSDYGSVGE